MNILVVDDEELIRWSIRERLEKDGHQVMEAGDGAEARKALESVPDLVLLDLKLPDTDGISILKHIRERSAELPVVIMTAYSTLQTAIDAMKLGAYDYLSKPFQLDDLTMTVRRAAEVCTYRQEAKLRTTENRSQFGIHSLVGRSREMQKVVQLVRKVAGSGAATILLRGESGTGKDLVAKAIHYESDRAMRPFMNITCTALPETLLESELFGHEKGSFTDAKVQKKGLFELAEGGTVFLDEIGDMSAVLQAKLLRVLEERAFRRVGGSQDIRVNVRIIAATNRPLEKMIREKTFREDLYYRLNVVMIELPALRERREDLPALVDHFQKTFTQEFRKNSTQVSEEAMKVLKEHEWPGNIRELRNVIERAVLLGTGPAILPDDIVLGMSAATRDPEGPAWKLPREGINFLELEKSLISQALAKAKGNKTRAGRLLKMTRDQITYRLEKFGLDKDDDDDKP